MATESRLVHSLVRLAKFPVEALVSSMEATAAAGRRLQQLYEASLDAAASTIERTAASVGGSGATRPDPAPAASELVRDTVNGLLAFVVPGPDAYSVMQGVSTVEPGGVDAGVADALIKSFDTAQPSPPQAPPPSAAVTGLLNQIAAQVNPAVAGSAGSAFARLSFAEKAAVFALLEKDPSLAQYRVLAGLLLLVPAALAYSEYGVFDFKDRSLTGRPVGWSISKYTGVADGRDDFKGYFQGRSEPLPSAYRHRSRKGTNLDA
jgi:hypothetical protein